MTKHYKKLLFILLGISTYQIFGSHLPKTVVSQEKHQREHEEHLPNSLHELVKIPEDQTNSERAYQVLQKIEEFVSDETIDEVDEDGYAPLYYAVIGNNANAVAILLDGGADKSKLQQTDYLEYLSQAGYEEIEDLLDLQEDIGDEVVYEPFQAHLAHTIYFNGKLFVIPYRNDDELCQNISYFVAEFQANPGQFL